jgi:hypothetical protein
VTFATYNELFHPVKHFVPVVSLSPVKDPAILVGTTTRLLRLIKLLMISIFVPASGCLKRARLIVSVVLKLLDDLDVLQEKAFGELLF